MQCGRLNLSQRVRARGRGVTAISSDRPRRYCQKRLVDPDHDEDPRWREGVLERFRCGIITEEEHSYHDESQQEIQNQNEELFLSVQNLQFEGDAQECKRPHTCFKYMSVRGSDKHRMFIKQAVEVNQEELDESQLSADLDFYFDDYVKYIINRTEQSRPSTGRSSIYFQRSRAVQKQKVNKSVQVNYNVDVSTVRENIINTKTKNVMNSRSVAQKIDSTISAEECMENTKINYYNEGKRKSLTISRAQSPETVQVIRVDVVCNNSSNISIASASDEKHEAENKLSKERNEKDDIKRNNFVNKYLLTNTIKTLDENVGGGSKVTLLCKTFRLADRSNLHNNMEAKPFIKDNHMSKTKRIIKKKK